MTDVVQVAVDAIAFGSLYAMFALGIALVFGIMQLINFAYGELIMVGAYSLVLMGSLPFVPLGLLTIAVVVIAALAMERTAFRPVRGADASTLLVTSFAVSFLVQNLAILILGPQTRSIEILPSLSRSLDVGGVSIGALDLVTIIVTAILLGSLLIFLARTSLGIQMRAAAEDFRMARLLGVRANTIVALGFAMSGVLAAVAAILLMTRTGSVTPTIGASAVLIAFIATIVGGIGSLGGAVAGGYALGIVTVLFQEVLPVELSPYRDAFVFLLVILVLVVRPQGLVPGRGASRVV